MIKFIRHAARQDYQVGRYKIKKGDPILKILFDKKDIHKSRKGQLHLDIWGRKLLDLKFTL